jgi:lamin tail-like protein
VPVIRAVPIAPYRLLAGLISVGVLALSIDHALAIPWTDGAGGMVLPTVSDHLVVSEVMTGGASASDEFIELYNPTAATLPLEGLELVYVTATGATVTRKAAWSSGAAGIPAGGHVLITNGGGIFAALGDVTYANGLAATGGSVALRVIAAATAIDAVGWGNAASTWLETQPAPAPAAGSSLERLPGGASGSVQDTDDNLLDFTVQTIPDPQNSGSPVVPSASASPVATASPVASPTSTPIPTPMATPTAEPSPSGTPSPSPTPAITASPTPTPTPALISIADARAQADGATVTVEGFSLTAGDFTDGGGYLTDLGAGIAVLLSDGSFPRGQLMRVTGTVDDRYAQRTIRAASDGIVGTGAGSDPLPLDATTGSIGEGVEGRLVEVSGTITSGVTTLSTGLAWDLDDGSGPSRILVGTATGIDTSAWSRGVALTLIGVVGQRDSSGSGTSGYRVQPRDTADIVSVEPAATPTLSPTPPPTASPSPSVTPSPTPTPSSPLVPINEARGAPTGTHLRIRGVVTAPSGLIEVGSAVVQDATGAILVRMGSDVGTLALGQLVELDGVRATKAGMLSLRVSTQPLVLGSQADPEPLRRATGALGEAEEARLVIVRGAISGAISRPKGGNVSFAVDDGSGQVRVTISTRSTIQTGSLTKGTWIELRGVLGQETTGSAPSSGYRLWPRVPDDLRVVAAPLTSSTTTTRCCPVAGAPRAPKAGDLLPASGGQAVATPAGIGPVLGRPQPTGSPRPLISSASTTTAGAGPVTPAAGLVVSGMGLAALAGLAAWFGRRRGPDDDPELADGAAESAEVAAAHDELGAPRLSLVPAEPADARNERRILPPT